MAVKIQDATDRATAAIDIRAPLVEDLASIARISNSASRHTVANFRTAPDTLDYWQDQWRDRCDKYPWLVAVQGRAVAGYAMAIPFMARCGLNAVAEVSVYVDPPQHGAGVGSALYQTLLLMLRANGFRSVVAAIAIPNPASERLHSKFGFRKAGTLVSIGRILGEWHDLSYWQLMLEPAEQAGSRCEGKTKPRNGDDSNAGRQGSE